MNDSSTTSSRRPRKSRAKLAIAGVVLLGLIGFGVYKYTSSGAAENEYNTAGVQFGDIEDLVTATGILEPRDFVDVGAQVTGQIEEIFVEVGDEVKAGDVLARIDATTSEARVEANKASLESAKTNLESRKADLAKAERDFQRQKNLLADDATTEEAYLNAETTLANARRNVRSQELSIEQSEHNMRIEAKNLAYTSITAPINGTVMSIAVKEGQSVNASQSVPVVLRLANLGTMTVRSDVSEADVNKLYEGMDVYFTTLSSNRRWYGKLKRREPTPKVQQGVVLYPALFDVENEGDTLMPSMTTQVFFVVAEARNVLVMPLAALQQGQQIQRKLAAQAGENGGAVAGAGGPNMTARNAGGTPGAAAAAGGSAPPSAGEAGPEGAAARGPGAGGPPGAGGGRQGGFGGGGPGGFNGGQGLTPEQIEEIRRARGGGAGGFGGRGGGPGGFAMGSAGGGTGRAGAPQQRRGTVMVMRADGTLEPRQVVIGVTNRVHGEVLEGLTEGEQVVVGTREEQEAAVSAAGAATQNNNNNFRGGGGGFPGGGRF